MTSVLAEFACIRGRPPELDDLLRAYSHHHRLRAPPAGVTLGELSTIIVPCYQHADYLPDTLDSVRQQDYRPLEVVAVDDASTDATASVLPRLLKELPSDISVRMVRRRRNRGQSSAINLAVGLAKGNVYTILNSDDYLSADAVRLAREIMATEQAHLFGANCDVFWGELPEQSQINRGATEITVDRYAPNTIYDRLREFNMTHSGTTFTRAAFDAVGGYRPWKRGRIFHSADRDFQLRVATLAVVAISPQESLSLWRQGTSVDAGLFS